MSGFIQGEDRFQATLFPERLDDYVAEDSACRVIDVFIDELDLSGMGFKTQPNETGRPAYHPTTMLKLFVYGYLNRVHSSRRLEREAQRNVELMWLTGRLAPAEDKTRSLEDKIASLKKEMSRLKKAEARMLKAPGQQISLTDPDARSMKSRGAGVVGYNVQTAVDTKHHMIVAHEVTNQGSDRRQLANMAKQAKTALATDELTVFADRGYYRSEELKDCEEANITTYLPKPQTSGNQAKGQFGRDAFHYIVEDDEYECPAGLRLVYHTTMQDRGKALLCYWTSKCRTCAIKAQCTSGTYRKMTRWEHETVLERAQARLDRSPDAMRIRRATVEHPFGTLKAWMGSTHFLTKTLDRVSTEMSLHVLAYNMKRMMNIIGTKSLIEAMGV